MDSPCLNLLDEALIRIRDPDGETGRVSLPDLFVALVNDRVRDYPALRPHQRHPWHALLVQLAALALHEAGETQPWTSAADWRAGLIALTPDHADGCAFSLVSPHTRPAFLQAPVPEGTLDGWKPIATPDALDMLVTSKNHDLKGERMRRAGADDWLFALTSLQTQEGVMGNGKYGIARMNGGYGNRPSLGIVPSGCAGARWRRDLAALHDARDEIAETIGLKVNGGTTLLWLPTWDGTRSLAISDLDPFFIEICRRVRFEANGGQIARAYDTTSSVRRVDAKARNGIVGDAWMPINLAEEKSFKVTARGFSYDIAVELIWGANFQRTVAQTLRPEDGLSGIAVLAQGVARGEGGTEGYHERRIPFGTKGIGFFRSGQTDLPARIAMERVDTISKIRKLVLRPALVVLIDAGKERRKPSDVPENIKARADVICSRFERAEDARFFDDLNREIEAEDGNAERLAWLIGLAERAEAVLRSAFSLGPQCGERRYRARSRALSYFHGVLRGDKIFPALAQHLRSQPAAEEAAS